MPQTPISQILFYQSQNVQFAIIYYKEQQKIHIWEAETRSCLEFLLEKWLK